MKTIYKMFNHEVWHVCSYCGFEFDARIESCQCPDCGHDLRKDNH